MNKRPKMEYRKLSSLKMSSFNDQVFRNLSPEETQELADSIKANGVINPISIKPNGTIIAGHQRYRGAQYAKLAEVPVIVHDLTEREAFRLWISENVHRRNLSTRETILGNYLLIVDKIAEMRGQEFSNKLALDAKTLKTISDGELTRAIAELMAGGDVRHKERAIRMHVLIASGLVKDLQELVFSGKLSQQVGAAVAALPEADQQHIADLVSQGLLGVGQIDEMQKQLKELNKEHKELQKEHKQLLKRLEEIAAGQGEAFAAQTEQLREEHRKEMEKLEKEKTELNDRIEKIAKQAEVIATRAKYDKLIQSILLLDSIASKGTAQEAMADRVQFGVFDETFILMMEHVSRFLADCVKEVRKQAFQDRAKSKLLQIAR